MPWTTWPAIKSITGMIRMALLLGRRVIVFVEAANRQQRIILDEWHAGITRSFPSRMHESSKSRNNFVVSSFRNFVITWGVFRGYNLTMPTNQDRLLAMFKGSEVVANA